MFSIRGNEVYLHELWKNKKQNQNFSKNVNNWVFWFQPANKWKDINFINAVVTPLRKAASYNEPRIAILGIWGDTWLPRGKYGIYVAVRGSYGVYVTPSTT